MRLPGLARFRLRLSSRMRRALATAAGAVVVGAGVVAGWLGATLPDVGRLTTDAPPQSSFMRLRAAETGTATAFRMGTLPLDSISPLLVCAVAKAEDRRFFRHGGFDWRQLHRAAGRRLSGTSRMGGSTITQQTARNLYLGPERTAARKLREAAITWRLERQVGKRRILELYLNGIEWGDGVWGAEQASRHHLGRGAGELDAFEATLLASLIAAPRQPLTGANRARAERVQRRVLNQLRAAGVLAPPEWLDAHVRADTLRERLERGLPLRASLWRPASPSSSSPSSPGVRTVEAMVAGECGLPRELGER